MKRRRPATAAAPNDCTIGIDTKGRDSSSGIFHDTNGRSLYARDRVMVVASFNLNHVYFDKEFLCDPTFPTP